MEPTFLPPDQFVKEVKGWGITKESRHRVRFMKIGDAFYFRFAMPDTSEIIQTWIPEEEYFRFKFVELAPLITPAIWELNSINTLKKKIEELNATISTNNRSESIRARLEFSS